MVSPKTDPWPTPTIKITVTKDNINHGQTMINALVTTILFFFLFVSISFSASVISSYSRLIGR